MKKIKQQSNHLIRMVALLALLLVGINASWGKTLSATFQTPASEGHWDSSSNTYSWTLGWSNLMEIFDFTGANEGKLAEYESIHLNFTWKGTVAYANHFRLVFQDADHKTIKINGADVEIVFGSDGDKTITFSSHETTKNLNLADVRYISIGGKAYDSNNGTHAVTIDPTSVYLTGPSTVTFLANNASWGTVTAKRVDTGAAINSGDQVPHGTQVQFTRTPNTNYLAWRWKIGASTYDYNPSTTITVNEDVNVTYEFSRGHKFSVVTTNGNYGSVVASCGDLRGNDIHVTPWPADVILTATPVGAATLAGWYTDVDCQNPLVEETDKIVISGNTVTYKGGALTNSIDNDESENNVHMFWAKFNPPPSQTVNFEVVNPEGTAQSGGYGTVTATVDGTEISSGASVEQGKQVVFTANPADGKIAWGWYKDDARNYEGNPYTVTVGDAALTVNAVIHDGITLTAIQSSSSTSYGTTRVECSGDRGTSFHTNQGTPGVQFIATPKTGATFAGWYSDDACNEKVSDSNPYNIDNPEADKTLYAKFTVPAGTYGVSWSTSGKEEGCDAWFTIGDEETEYRESVFGIENGKKINLHATDDTPKYIFAKYTIGETSRWNNKNIDVTIDEADLTISADFCPAFTYRATANVSATLKITPNEGTNDINGVKQKTWDGLTKVTFSSSAESGLQFTGWYNTEGTEVSTENPYVISSDIQKKDLTLEARYTIPAPIGGQRIKAQLTNLAKGNVPTWENGHMATDATSYNHVDIFRFSNVPDGNVNVTGTAADYTGIRFHAKATTPFRVLVYINGETNPRIVTLESGEKEYTYTWAELGVPAASIENIARVCFAGQQNGSTDVTFDNVWIEKIDDPCHTFVMYGETGGVYNSGTYTYTLATPEGNATAVFNSIDGGSRRGYTKEIKLENQLTITAPSNKRIKALKVITDVQASELVFTGLNNEANDAYSTAVTDGYEVVWTHDKVQSVTITNASSKKANIAKIEVIYDNDNIKHPALNKNAPGQYAANLAKITTTGGFAYDAETNTVYSSSTVAYGGDIRIDFETPQDFTNLTKIIIGSDDTSIFNFCNLVPTTAADYRDYIGVRLGSEGFTDDQKTAINGKQIKTIIIGSSALTTGKMKLNYIGFDISHIDPKVALDEGIATYYKIGVGQRLTLTAHATQGENGPNDVFWSAWNGVNASDGAVQDGLRVWAPSYTFTATEEGHFYFGARAKQDCSAHTGNANNWSSAEGAIVHVEVVKNNIYENLNLDFTGNTYTEDGWAKGRQYRIYVPQSICNGTDADKANVPVVFSLHGTKNNNNPDEGGVQNFNELAEQHKFIVVYPNGRNDIPELWGRGWEATGKENEDTKFFRAIIADLKNDRAEFKLGGTKQFTSIDESRIYMTGFSNGGMMAYAEANTSADIFAAFGSISGYPINEMHMRHHNDRPVPFIHIHGTKDGFVKYSHMPTIVDNMLFRNGLAITPNEIGEGSANGGATRYKMSSYTDGEAPYVYYEIGTGSNTSDTGMGHESQCTIGDKSSMQVMWEFFEHKSLPNTISNPFEFKARINTANNLAREHGWQTNTSSGILAQYGESGGYTTTEENVYHTIHLGNGDNNGKHSIQFKANSTETTHYVMVKVTKLADFEAFNTMGKHQVAVTEDVILNNVAYYVHPDKDGGIISIPFSGGEGEYMITITKGGKWDNTTLQDVAIVEGEVTKGDPYDKPVDTNFGGYFNYNNRLFAQWNFDLSDGYRTNARKLQANADEHNDNRAWTANLSNTDYNGTTLNNGTVVFSNHKPLGTHIGDDNYNTDLSTYDELTYDGTYDQGATNNNLIAVAAGLKFKAPAESVKIYVDIANGQVSGAHLVVDEKVKMYVPYVENSYRNDKDQFSQPQDHKDDFKNCMHHINRDILYIALNQGSIWDEWNNGHFVSVGHVKNRCIDLTEEELFRNGGDEFVNGKNYNKADYMGKAGTPCILQFNRETNIDRIGVNRNLIYSFYTEYIAELGKTKPSTRFRVVGSPTGQKIANDGDTWTEYTGAIAMTYGGWMNSKGGSTYKKWNDNETTDAWTDLGVMNYEPNNSAVHFKTWGSMQPAEAGTNSMPSIDGFPVVALLDTEARSGSLLPSSLAPTVTPINGIDYVTEQNKEGNNVYVPNYFPQCEGLYMVPTQSAPYKANITPWSLPSRGGYAKFEPSLPGVLNMNVVQKGGCAYFIADEFGKLVDQSTIFSRTGSGQTISKANNCYTVAQTDYVKHSLNVEPGKTYYIFSNDAGLGLAGFYFEPYVNHDGTERGRVNIGVREMNLSATVAYALPDNVSGTETIYSPGLESTQIPYTVNYSRKAVKVNLRRAFKANQWETICLPYSMNQVQMEQVFGEGTRVVLLRDIQNAEHSVENKVTCTLICHENQDIIAGYPYLIRPTKAAPNGVVTIASLPETNNLPSLVTVSSVGPNTNSYADKTYGGIGDYTFKGHYGGKATVRQGSYAVVDGLLKRVTATSISGYRAWLDLNESVQDPALAKKIAFFVGADGQVDGDATDIDEIDIDAMLEQQGIFAKNTTIYGIDGHVVRENATNLNGLAKGIYIVNGKKYVVK